MQNIAEMQDEMGGKSQQEPMRFAKAGKMSMA